MHLALPQAVVFPRRWRATGLHLAISFCVAALAAAVIFLLWFPAPLGVAAGGMDLFVLLMSVDVIAGPALTFVAANPKKPQAELQRDLTIIVLLQLAALVYGMYAISEARPILLSFEVDRFRLISAAEIDPATLHEAPEGLRSLSWTGPRRIAALKPVDPEQAFRSMELGLSGIDLSMDPRNWRPYDAHAAAAWTAAKPLRNVIDRYPHTAADAAKIASSSAQPLDALRYLPLQARRAIWVAVLAEPSAEIVGYLPVDGFL